MSDGIELTDDEYDTFMAVLAEQRCQHSRADTACPPPPERAILTDLIEELREGHPTFGDEPPLWVKTALYAAEARLREVGGHE